MLRLRAFLAVLALLTAQLPLAAAPAPPGYPEGRPLFHILDARDGLPQTSVMALAMGPQGVLWVGTADGAAYSTGTTWHTVTIPDHARSNYVQAILHASDGAIWFARQDGGVSRLQDGQWTTYNTSNGLPQDRVNALAETRDADGTSRIWAGLHGNGLACFQRGAWSQLTVEDGLPDGKVWCLKASRGGQALWIGTDNGGLVRWEAGHFTRYSGLPPASVNSLVERTGPDGQPDLYVGTYGFGVAHWTGGAWHLFSTRDGLPSDFITDLCDLQDPDGRDTLWATTLNGLVRYREGRWTAFTRRTGLPTSTLYRLLPVRSPEGRGRLWIGSGGAGLLRLDLGGWTTLDIQDGLPDDNVWSMAETTARDGAPILWVGTSKGLVRWHRGHWTHVAGRDRVMCLTVDVSGTVWAGTLSGLDRVAPDGRLAHVDTHNGLPHNRVSCALATVGPGGRPQLWFGTEGGGLVRESEGRWTAVGLRQGLPYPTVNCLFRTVDRRFGEVIWAGLRSQGLAGWKPDGSWIRFTSADGLPNENITALQEIHVPSGRRELWAGSFGKGMARLTLDDPQARWRPVTVEGRPVQDIVQSILQGPRGNVYVYTLHGILRIDRDRLETPGPLPATVFDQEDGLPSEQINPRSGFLDRRGRLWAGTTSGLACLDPSEVILDRTPKPLQLQASLMSKGRTQPLASGTRLPYRAGSLGFQFTLVDFFKTSAHRYQSLLEGLEDRPTAWSPAASREFTNLPPGTYTFKVWGLDASGNVSGPVAFPFSVRPALWQTPWFLGLVLVAVAAAASVAMRWRERLLHRRNQELSALVLSRTQDLLHTNQRLQEEAREREQAERAKADFVAAVSHELRTPLTSIRGSLGMLAGGVSGDLPAPAHNLVDIAHRNTVKLLSLVDDLLDHQKVEAGRMELSLAPVELNAFLHQAVEDHTGYAESFGVTCQIIGPGRPAWILGDLQRLHQVLANLLSNATKYATLDKRIRITLKVKGPLARIEVFNPGEPIPETFRARIFQPFEQADQGNTRTARGTGLGLHISKAIVELHHGRIGYTTGEEGTTFHVELPLIDGPADPRRNREPR